MDVLRTLPTMRLRILRSSIPNLTSVCHNSRDGAGDNSVSDLPEEPTTCCMSGCPNCVWVEYAEKLSRFYRDGGEKARQQIEEKITDPNMKAFILHELRMRNLQS